MRFDILTLFPEMLCAVLDKSITGRAKAKGILETNYINIRDFSTDKHRRVDDYPYGGGSGMVMQPQPIFDTYSSITKDLDYKPKTIYLTPQGKVFKQSTAKKLAKCNHIILLCGHYEGVDQRVLDEIVDEEISVGDFVLTGGEIAAMAVVDAVSRLVDGVLSSEEAHLKESLNGNLLEHPQYTRPAVWRGKEAPAVLQNGNHKEIEKWKREQSILATYNKRRSLLSRAKLTKAELEFINNKNN